MIRVDEPELDVAELEALSRKAGAALQAGEWARRPGVAVAAGRAAAGRACADAARQVRAPAGAVAPAGA
jgi:hypothetical protein